MLLIVAVLDSNQLVTQLVQGVPKKMWFKPIFEFMTLEGVFLGVKNSSKNFGNKKILGYLAKFWVNGPCFIENLTIFPKFLELFFTPKNTPSKVKNSKMGLNQIFFGTPCNLELYMNVL